MKRRVGIDLLRLAYTYQRLGAKKRGIAWQFTYEEWQAVWLQSGHLGERGRGRDKYVMARKGDCGAYTTSNVEIITGPQNLRDAHVNVRPNSRRLGKGRGWTMNSGRFQVTVANRYIGLFGTQGEAEAARICSSCNADRERVFAGPRSMTPSLTPAQGASPPLQSMKRSTGNRCADISTWGVGESRLDHSQEQYLRDLDETEGDACFFSGMGELAWGRN